MKYVFCYKYLVSLDISVGRRVGFMQNMLISANQIKKIEKGLSGGTCGTEERNIEDFSGET
jgi:hypothetical protein